MALKPVFDNKADITAGMESYYVEVNDKWILDVEESQGFKLENITNLKTALQSERQSSKDLKLQLSAFGELTPDKIQELIADKDKLQTTTSQGLDQLELIKKNHQKKVDELSQMLNAKNTQMSDYILNNELNSVLADAKLKENGAYLLRPHLKNRLSLVDNKVTILDDQGSPLLSNNLNDIGNMGLKEYMGIIQKNEKFADLFTSELPQGTGSKTSQGNGNLDQSNNPYLKGNLTEICRLEKNSPQEAQRMKAAAQNKT